LSNMKRCADQFSIRSSMESGTEVEAVVNIIPEAGSGPAVPGRSAESKAGRTP
jgi:hypothetical protein